ncbi:MAG: hypothetical protein U9Q15_03225 [Patescibacteria group bacterium]|nr:hypothetical protein [Patescibacteria group bacterium]
MDTQKTSTQTVEQNNIDTDFETAAPEQATTPSTQNQQAGSVVANQAIHQAEHLKDQALETFKKLNPNSQFAAIGALLILLSSLAPWWSRVTSKGVETLNLFEGPMYFGGLLILLSTLFVVATITAEYFGKTLPKIKLTNMQSYAQAGIISSVLVMMNFSVYTSPFLSESSSSAQSGLSWGAYIGLFGALMIVMAGFAKPIKKQSTNDNTQA